MTVFEFGEKFSLKTLNKGADRQIAGGFCGDLLSWVMANAQENNVWFTVMGNINSIAVASLNDVACIVLCQGSSINADALKKAAEEGINILSTEKSMFEISGLLYRELNG